MTTCIADTARYNEMVSRAVRVEHPLWIGTAGIKGLYVRVVRVSA